MPQSRQRLLLLFAAALSCVPLLVTLCLYDVMGTTGRAMLRLSGGVVRETPPPQAAAATHRPSSLGVVRLDVVRLDVVAPPSSASPAGSAAPCRLLVAFEYDAARLGNKLFQYASTVAVAHRHRLPTLAVVDSPQKRQYFRVMKSVFSLSVGSTDDGSVLRSVRWIGEPGFAMYDRRVDDGSEFDRCRGGGRDVAFSGYLQSWKYFRGTEHVIRREYKLSPEYERIAALFLLEAGRTVAAIVNATTEAFVGVHVRRGDMAFAGGRYSVASESYLLGAMRRFESKLGAGVVFVVATDDEPWVMQALTGQPDLVARTVYSRGSAEVDLAILSRCNHSIVTSGSYGWWAGWLTGGEVVYYRDYIPPSSDLASQFSADDYYPPVWIAMR